MITEITPTSNFQLSAVGVGVIAIGLADIRQCIDIILRTIPGSDPLRPLFGCDIYKYVDDPVNVGIPNMKKVIFEALELWEPRITVTSITHETKIETVFFNITYKVNGSDLTDMLVWGGNSDMVNTTGLILTADVSPKILNGRYNVTLNINGSAAYPAPPLYGFETPKDMLDWVADKWQSFGKWYLTANKLVLYFAGIEIKSANMIVTQSSMLTEVEQIPYLENDQFFNLDLIIDGQNALPEFQPNTHNTLEQLLIWLTANWGVYGDWYIVNSVGTVLVGGDFNSDFDDDFTTGTSAPGRVLIFQTKLFSTAILEFI